MADEAATLEAPVEEPVVAPEEPASPVEGDAPSEGEGERLGLIRELFKGATVAELRAALDDVPQETRTELEAEIERRGEQRARTRQQETQTAKQERLSLWKPYAERHQLATDYANRAIASMRQGNYDAFDPSTLESAVRDSALGAAAQIVLANEGYVPDLIDTLLPDMTPEEQAKLDKPLYEFGRTGVAAQLVPLVVELATTRARAEGFAEGVKKGQQDKAAKAALAEKLANIETIRKQAAGVSVNGHAVTAEDERTQIQREIREFDPAKFPSLYEATQALDKLKQRASNLRAQE